MSVHLKGKEDVPYLDQDLIREYSCWTFKSLNGGQVKLNPCVLAALRSSVVLSLDISDYDDCMVITDFENNDLKELEEFCFNGKGNSQVLDPLFECFGIDPERFKNATSDDSVTTIFKQEVKEEVVDYDVSDYDNEPAFDEPEVIIKKRGKKRKTDDDDWEEDDTEDEDEDWSPEETTPKKQKTSTTPRIRNRSKVDTESIKSFKLPQPLEYYKLPPSEPHLKLPRGQTDLSKKLSCNKCEARFSIKYSLNEHKTKYHSDHYECPHCKRCFKLNEVDKFRRHMFKHENNLLISTATTCIQCGKHFPFSSQYQEHMKTRGPYHDDECSMCTQKFTSYEEYKNHVDIVHDGHWKLKCGHCREQFIDEAALKSHVWHTHLGKPLPKARKERKKTKPKKKMCQECGAEVLGLSNHMESVHGERNCPCPECGKLFRGNMLLKGHISKVHSKIPCTMCGDMVSKGKLAFHIHQKHTPSSERRYKCEHCGKGFSEIGRLRDHVNIHTGAKPHKCKFCNAAFASNGNKAAHERSHLGIKRAK